MYLDRRDARKGRCRLRAAAAFAAALAGAASLPSAWLGAPGTRPSSAAGQSHPGASSQIVAWPQVSAEPLRRGSPEFAGHEDWPFRTLAAAAAGALATFLLAGAVVAAEAPESLAGVAPCLLQKCQAPLAKCLLSPSCAADLTCILGCQGQKDIGACEVRCGDFFENPAVQEFNRCALKPNKNGCVPQRVTLDYPEPPAEAISKQFDITSFNGPWYISAGLNPLFDTFPCQVHFFVGEPPNVLENSSGRLFAKINWRVPEPDGEFFDRSTVQRFKVDPERPGVLYNHGNEYLHYEDDWFILDHSDETEKDKGFILVYYRGRNDAWDGYGGAVLYTRGNGVPEGIVPRLRAACKAAGIDWDKFAYNDNQCNVIRDPVRLRRRYVEKSVNQATLSVETQLTQARKFVTETVVSDEKFAEVSVGKFEKGFETEFSKEYAAATRLEMRLAGMVQAFTSEVNKDAVYFEKQASTFYKTESTELERLESRLFVTPLKPIQSENNKS